MMTQSSFYITLSIIIMSTSAHATNSDSQLVERKAAFANAAYRVAPRWVVGRLKPVALASMLCVPPIVGFVDVMGHMDHGTPSELSGYLMASGYILLPVAAAIIARQGLLVVRDLKLYSDFTSSKTSIVLQDFPTTDELKKMKNHHQLLSGLAAYTKKQGNLLEKAALLTPGLRGYRNENTISKT